MARCQNCNWVVDTYAVQCPNCGRQYPTVMGRFMENCRRGEPMPDPEGQATAIAFLIVLAPAIFLLPAFAVVYPHAKTFEEAFWVCVGSWWTWAGSAAVWAFVWYVIHRIRQAKRQRVGRMFYCWNCNNSVQEHVFGALESSGVVCPFCNATNICD